MPDRTIFSGRIHRLKNQKQSVAIGRIVQLLHRAQLFDMLLKQRVVLRLRVVYRIDQRRPFLEIDLITLPDAKVIRMDLHLCP